MSPGLVVIEGSSFDEIVQKATRQATENDAIVFIRYDTGVIMPVLPGLHPKRVKQDYVNELRKRQTDERRSGQDRRLEARLGSLERRRIA